MWQFVAEAHFHFCYHRIAWAVEYIIFKALNAAIKANFPNENVKIGFLHGEAKRQQDQTSQDRIKNN